MESETCLLLAVAAAVAASGCAHAASPEPATPDEEQENRNNTVFYTDSGFQPRTLEIQQGETVTWLDRSPQPMWVAVDLHPSHTQYDGSSLGQHCPGSSFDQCSTGDRFSFTFEKTGTFRYHNHESPGDTGSVVVN